MNRSTTLSSATRSAVRSVFFGAVILAPYVVGSLLESALLAPVGGAA
jgi:hypothetical protein